jgi:hypothetical protein
MWECIDVKQGKSKTAIDTIRKGYLAVFDGIYKTRIKSGSTDETKSFEMFI